MRIYDYFRESIEKDGYDTIYLINNKNRELTKVSAESLKVINADIEKLEFSNMCYLSNKRIAVEINGEHIHNAWGYIITDDAVMSTSGEFYIGKDVVAAFDRIYSQVEVAVYNGCEWDINSAWSDAANEFENYLNLKFNK